MRLYSPYGLLGDRAKQIQCCIYIHAFNLLIQFGLYIYFLLKWIILLLLLMNLTTLNISYFILKRSSVERKKKKVGQSESRFLYLDHKIQTNRKPGQNCHLYRKFRIDDPGLCVCENRLWSPVEKLACREEGLSDLQLTPSPNVVIWCIVSLLTTTYHSSSCFFHSMVTSDA